MTLKLTSRAKKNPCMYNLKYTHKIELYCILAI